MHVCVAICTRDRPKMLGAAVRSVLAIRPPEGARLSLLVVENTPVAELGLHTLVDAQREAPPSNNGFSCMYLHQPRIGVATARNTALDWARAEHCDWLAFIDDDETVHPDWLINLLAVAMARALVLTSGPVFPVVESRPVSSVQRAIWQGYARQRHRHRVRAARLADAGRDGRITAITNNWLLDLHNPAAGNQRFDMRFDASGGEDSDFYRRLRGLGATSGWAREAVVYETIPHARLTVAYQFRRAFHQSAVRLNEKTKDASPLGAAFQISCKAFINLFLGLAYLLLVLPSAGRTLFDSIRHIGAGCGAFLALTPPATGFYQSVTGE